MHAHVSHTPCVHTRRTISRAKPDMPQDQHVCTDRGVYAALSVFVTQRRCIGARIKFSHETTDSWRRRRQRCCCTMTAHSTQVTRGYKPGRGTHTKSHRHQLNVLIDNKLIHIKPTVTGGTHTYTHMPQDDTRSKHTHSQNTNTRKSYAAVVFIQ